MGTLINRVAIEDSDLSLLWAHMPTYCKFGNFARVLFSRNFAYVKFRENKTFAK